MRTCFENLITCGRGASGAEHDWDVLRVIPPAMLTRQVAGTAAARAIVEGALVYG